LFESGALSKTVEKARVCPYLLGLGPENLSPPLSDFNAAKADQGDTFRLLVSINDALGAQRLPRNKLQKAFDQWWDVLRKKLDEIPPAEEAVKQPSLEEKIEEVFRYIRRVGTAKPNDFGAVSREYWLSELSKRRARARERIAAATSLLDDANVPEAEKMAARRGRQQWMEELVQIDEDMMRVRDSTAAGTSGQ
jgi:hypothetical protein